MQLENTVLKAKIESKERARACARPKLQATQELDRCIESKRLLMATSNDFDMQLHAIMSELRSKAALLKDAQKSNAALVRERNAAERVHALRAQYAAMRRSWKSYCTSPEAGRTRCAAGSGCGDLQNGLWKF